MRCPGVALSMTAQSWEDFRAERNRSLPAPHGWLSLTSLQWLPGEPGPLVGLPGRWSAADGVARVSAAAADGLLLVRGGSANQNQAVDGTIEARLAEDESLNWLRSGTVLLELAMRGGAYAIRTRDAQAPALQGFNGVPVFDYGSEFALTGQFHRFPEAQERDIATANPRVPGRASFIGEVVFELDGQPQTLLAQKNGSGLLLNFRDASNGSETAGWRFLSTEAPDADGKVLLDFNFSLNWPSGFSAFGTCPQPVPENTLPARIAAGEKLP